MNSVNIRPSLTKDDLEEKIIELCKLSGEENGNVRVFSSHCDKDGSRVYAMFDTTVAQKPVEGTKEVTFAVKDQSNLIRVSHRDIQDLNITIMQGKRELLKLETAILVLSDDKTKIINGSFLGITLGKEGEKDTLIAFNYPSFRPFGPSINVRHSDSYEELEECSSIFHLTESGDAEPIA